MEIETRALTSGVCENFLARFFQIFLRTVYLAEGLGG
jgi:hypothetical protein